MEKILDVLMRAVVGIIAMFFVNAALKNAGIPEESYLRPRQLKTITDLEKILTKKGFKTILGDLVIKPEGKPTLVEEADPREPFSKAKNDFKDIIENL